MTLVMDGVRGGGVVRARAQKKRPAKAKTSQPVQVATATELRLGVGMDGLRRPVTTEAPQDGSILHEGASLSQESAQKAPFPERLETKEPDVAETLPGPAVEAVPEPAIPEMQPDLLLAAESNRKWRRQNWKRPAMAVGFAFATLIVSATTVRVLSARNNTASAEAVGAHAAVTATPKPHKTGLQALLNNFAATGGSNFGIVVKDLKTGETASVNPDQQMESASLYKLFVAQRIYQQIDLGQLKYTQDAGAGNGQTIGDCLTVMINISDNTCGRALGSILNWGDQDQALETEGYTNTDLATPQQTSAADVAKLLERLYGGTLVSPDSTNRFMSLLKDQKVNNRLPAGLPAGTVIAHKTGDLDNFSHDAGIVYGPQTNYLVVAMSGPWDAPANAPAAFTNLSQQLWNYFEQ